MTRATYRFREYTIAPDVDPDAEPVSFAAQCAVCDATGPQAESADDAHAWAFQHIRDHPEHLTYRSLVTLPYRVIPGAWQ
jgi:hypothetical protein